MSGSSSQVSVAADKTHSELHAKRNTNGGRPCTKEISVPVFSIANIIGRGGRTLKAMQMEPGIILVSVIQSNLNVVKVIGSRDAVERISIKIQELISTSETGRYYMRPRGRFENGALSRRPQVPIHEEVVEVPSFCIGEIIGRNGRNIKSLQREPGITSVVVIGYPQNVVVIKGSDINAVERISASLKQKLDAFLDFTVTCFNSFFSRPCGPPSNVMIKLQLSSGSTRRLSRNNGRAFAFQQIMFFFHSSIYQCTSDLATGDASDSSHKFARSQGDEDEVESETNSWFAAQSTQPRAPASNRGPVVTFITAPDWKQANYGGVLRQCLISATTTGLQTDQSQQRGGVDVRVVMGVGKCFFQCEGNILQSENDMGRNVVLTIPELNNLFLQQRLRHQFKSGNPDIFAKMHQRLNSGGTYVNSRIARTISISFVDNGRKQRYRISIPWPRNTPVNSRNIIDENYVGTSGPSLPFSNSSSDSEAAQDRVGELLLNSKFEIIKKNHGFVWFLREGNNSSDFRLTIESSARQGADSLRPDKEVVDWIEEAYGNKTTSGYLAFPNHPRFVCLVTRYKEVETYANRDFKVSIKKVIAASGSNHPSSKWEATVQSWRVRRSLCMRERELVAADVDMIMPHIDALVAEAAKLTRIKPFHRHSTD